jgi:hypothetical protein
MYNANQVCDKLKITIWTLTNWYQWERISLEDGTLSGRLLPVPIKDETRKGKPRMWSESQLEELKIFQGSIVRGRNGVMAKVTNPKSRHKK